MKTLPGFSFTFKLVPESCVSYMLQPAEKPPLHYAGTQLLGNTHALAGHTSLHTQHTQRPVHCAHRTIFLLDLFPPGLLIILLPFMLNTNGITLPVVLVFGPGQASEKEVQREREKTMQYFRTQHLVS